MIKLSEIVEQQVPNSGAYYDWMIDFNFFKTSINSSTERFKLEFKNKLSAKVLNKSVTANASKGYKQPVKVYTINKVTKVEVNDYYDEWVVILSDENDKQYFLIPGWKIKISAKQPLPLPTE